MTSALAYKEDWSQSKPLGHQRNDVREWRSRTELMKRAVGKYQQTIASVIDGFTRPGKRLNNRRLRA